MAVAAHHDHVRRELRCLLGDNVADLMILAGQRPDFDVHPMPAKVCRDVSGPRGVRVSDRGIDRQKADLGRECQEWKSLRHCPNCGGRVRPGEQNIDEVSPKWAARRNEEERMTRLEEDGFGKPVGDSALGIPIWRGRYVKIRTARLRDGEVRMALGQASMRLSTGAEVSAIVGA
jgi:hypothetical protein